MNGTVRPIGMWRISKVGPIDWIISHRPFLRAMGVEKFDSIYTPRYWSRTPRKIIPGLDYWWRRFRAEPMPRDDF